MVMPKGSGGATGGGMPTGEALRSAHIRALATVQSLEQENASLRAEQKTKRMKPEEVELYLEPHGPNLCERTELEPLPVRFTSAFSREAHIRTGLSDHLNPICHSLMRYTLRSKPRFRSWRRR